MIYVDGGTLTLGSNYAQPNEGPLHDVRLSPFLMSMCEITQGVYEQIMGTNPSFVNNGDPALPVDSVAWLDAVKFCNALSVYQGFAPCYTIYEDPADMLVVLDVSKDGYRLPTEAEWEYAARGGPSSPEYLYSGSNTLNDVSWNSLNSYDSSHPVADLNPNALDLYDMSGNVAEWCWDGYDSEADSTNFYNWYAFDYYTYLLANEPVQNPLGPNDNVMWYDTVNTVSTSWCPYPIIRGGDYHFSTDYNRVTSRYGGYTAYNQYFHVGFRVVRKP